MIFQNISNEFSTPKSVMLQWALPYLVEHILDNISWCVNCSFNLAEVTQKLKFTFQISNCLGNFKGLETSPKPLFKIRNDAILWTCKLLKVRMYDDELFLRNSSRQLTIETLEQGVKYVQS